MAWCHSQSALDEFSPRLRVIVGGFMAPGDLWMTSFPSRVFSLSSMTSISETSPLISVNWAISMESISMANRYDASASEGRFGRPPAISQSLLFAERRAAGELRDAEHHEFGG